MCGQVPPQRIFLSKDQTELAFEERLSFPRDITQHPSGARRRHEQTRKHLENRCLSGAVWTQETDEFSFLDFERYIFGSIGLLVLSCDQAFQSAENTVLLFVGTISL